MIVLALGVAAAAATGVAFYKHKNLAGVKASAQKEVTYLESIASKVSTDVQTAFSASVARLKALF